MCELKHLSKHIVSRRNVHEEIKVQRGIQHI